MATVKSNVNEVTGEEFRRCECGCGVIVNPKCRFAIGHDAKLLSNLLREFDGGNAEAGEDLISARLEERSRTGQPSREERSQVEATGRPGSGESGAGSGQGEEGREVEDPERSRREPAPLVR